MRTRVLTLALLITSPALFAAEPVAKSSPDSSRSLDPEDAVGEAIASKGIWSSLKGSIKSVSDGTTSAAKATASTFTGIFKKKGPKAPLIKVAISYSPTLVPPKDSTTLDVLISLTNTGKKTQLLEFPSTQRVDAVLRDGGGQIVARANHPAEYQPETGFVTINPLERVEYHLEMPVQNLASGKSYTLEGAVTGQAGLLGRTTLVPNR